MITKEKVSIQCKDLIKELNLDYLPLEKQEEIIDEMSEVVYDRIILRVLGTLTEEDAVNLAKLIGEGKELEVTDILSKKVSDFEGLLRRELLDFQHEIIQSIK
ncbi:MAG: hypothetical protein PHI45_00130 [Candidatus Pacebacteria bacterium]|nr:hypothetical protein [Candidatus Paceibacterota bacterium]MDD5012901.1 hypothetical protein [Candidatus Paceibacterota bacterium]MDD5752485.1 hypothetical protein [Candidatus Paceibacterota bacterium]